MNDKDTEINIEYEKMVWREVVALNKELRKQLDQYEKGFKGACPTCEVVGELNVELEKRLEKAIEALEFLRSKSSDFAFYTDYETSFDTVRFDDYIETTIVKIKESK